MINDFSFLTSIRFYCAVAIAILGVLQAQGILTADVTLALQTIFGAIIGIRTANYATEAIAMSGK